MRHKDKIIFDTETTGLLEPNTIILSEQPHIIEIYAARLDHKNKVIDEVESFFTVPVELPKHITKITGIDEAMLSGAPEFVELYDDLCKLFLGATEMIGHNINFDAGMLWAELSRIDKVFNFPWIKEWYCTMEKSFHLENKRLRLGMLHKHATGKEYKDGAHRAKQDVLATLRCYDWMQKNGM
jgi:DNA polymerase-3 subunit epsilon